MRGKRAAKLASYPVLFCASCAFSRPPKRLDNAFYASCASSRPPETRTVRPLTHPLARRPNTVRRRCTLPFQTGATAAPSRSRFGTPVRAAQSEPRPSGSGQGAWGASFDAPARSAAKLAMSGYADYTKNQFGHPVWYFGPYPNCRSVRRHLRRGCAAVGCALGLYAFRSAPAYATD